MRIGFIENTQDLSRFVARRYETATAEEVLNATGGNTGNVGYVYGARKILGDQLIRIEWGTPVNVVQSSVDHLVICCANQLGSHVDLSGWAERLVEINKPVTLLGLGVQASSVDDLPALPRGTIQFLKVVRELNRSESANIATRGDHTRRFLETLGIESVPAGCPSLHISPIRELGRRILERQKASSLSRVAVAAGNPWHAPSAYLERALVEIVNIWRGEYVLQHPVGMLKFAYGESDIDEKTQNRFLEVYGETFDAHSLREWYRRNAAVFVDAATWMRHLQKFDLVIGPRYHGVALGLQAGIPGSVITIDARTAELCQGTGVKHIELSQALKCKARELVDLAYWDDANALAFDEMRLRQARLYKLFLERNGLTPSSHLKALAA